MTTDIDDAAVGEPPLLNPTCGVDTNSQKGNCVMSESNHTITEAEVLLSDLGATCDEIINASGWTLGELETAAIRAGRLREEYRRIPMFSDEHVGQLRRRILAERAELVVLGGEIRSLF